MTKVVYETYYDTHILECTGHTNYSCGSDILCSAVSILFATMKAYLEKAYHYGEVRNLKCIVNSGNSYLSFECSEDSPVLSGIDALLVGFNILSTQFGEYVSFEQ